MASKINKANVRTGTNPLGYLGVEPMTTVGLYIYDRAPTYHDYYNFDLMDLWMVDKGTTTPILDQEIWQLISKKPDPANAKPHPYATWIMIYPAAVEITLHTDNGDAVSVGRVLNLLGGGNLGVTWINMNTDAAGNTAHISLNPSIWQPNSTADQGQGVYGLGNDPFLHNYGTHNTFVGQTAGNFTLTVLNAIDNVGVGFSALHTLDNGTLNTAIGDTSLALCTDGLSNTAVGHGSQALLTTGSYNNSLGDLSLSQLVNGQMNIAFGWGAGQNYAGAEGSNIVIGNDGVLGESNVIRIGTTGVGLGQQNAAYLAGVYGSNHAAIANIVFADNAGKIATGANPNNGEVLIGGTNGPLWANLTAGVGIAITPGDHSIIITAAGGALGGMITAHTDGGVGHDAVQDGLNAITWAGDGTIVTDGAANTVTISLPGTATDGELLTSDGLGGAAWNRLVSGGGSVTITYPVPGTINLEAGGGGGGATTLQSDAGTANAVGGIINVLGWDNINTTGDNVQSLYVNLNTSIVQPITNAAATSGMYALGATVADTFLHNYGAVGAQNTWLGMLAGNLTLLAGSIDNTGIGANVLQSLTTGAGNVGVGVDSLAAQTTGSSSTAIGKESLEHTTTASNNTACGFQALNGITTGGNSIGLGYMAGASYTVADNSNIAIGHLGTAGHTNEIVIGTHGGGAGQQNKTFVAGIYGITPGSATRGVVVIDDAYQLGSLSGAAGTVFIGGTSPSWLPAGVAGLVLTSGGPGFNPTWAPGGGGGGPVLAGENTNINPASTVNLNRSIALPHSNAAGTEGFICLGGLPLDIVNNRFIHNYCGTGSAAGASTYVGFGAGSVSPTNTSATSCTGIGHLALHALTSGDSNTAIGRSSGYAITSGTANTLMGRSSGLSITSATYNTCIGYSSGSVIDTGGFNTLYGTNSGRRLTSGTYNTMLGTNAGYNAAAGGPSTGGNNIFIGANAGSVLSGASDSNIYIGYDGPGAGSTSTGKLIIGTDGFGSGFINSCTVAGIWNRYDAAYAYSRVVLATATSNQITGMSKLTTADVSGNQGIANGQLLIGGANGPKWATITQGFGITVTNTANTITIARSEGDIVAFLAYHAGTNNNLTGTGGTVWFGSWRTLTEVTDSHAAFYPGNGIGANATFTAPYTGLYAFTVQISYIYTAPPVPPPPTVTYYDPIIIRNVTTAKNYEQNMPFITTNPEDQTGCYTVVTKILANQVIQFGFAATLDPAGLRLGVTGIDETDTYIAGYLVKQL